MTTSLQERIAGQIRAELGFQGLTQGALAAALGRSEAYISVRLAKEDPKSFNTAELERVAAFLKVPVSQLLADRSAA